MSCQRMEIRADWTIFLAKLCSMFLDMVDFVNKQILERFSQSCSDEINNISELSKPLKLYPQNMVYIGDVGMTSGGLSLFLGTHVVGLLGATLSFSLHTFPRYRKKKCN